MAKNQKKYIATIVKKHCLGNECYLLSLDHVSIGELDEKTQLFTDKEGNEQSVIISVSQDSSPKEEIKVKYNENNPKDYYEETAILDKNGIIWFGAKIVIIIILVIIFFNKKLLSMINITSSSVKRNS